MKRFLSVIIILILVFTLVACSKKETVTMAEELPAELAAAFTVSSDGYLIVNGVKTQALVAGKDGQDGAVGPQGPQGEPGVQGPKGDAGGVGPQGPQGVAGPQGEKGVKGDKGDRGYDGDDGNTPSIGANGNWWIAGSDTGYKAAVSNDTVTVTFDVNGGTFPEGYETSIEVPKGSCITDLPIPGRPDHAYKFYGWFTGYDPITREIPEFGTAYQMTRFGYFPVPEESQTGAERLEHAYDYYDFSKSNAIQDFVTITTPINSDLTLTAIYDYVEAENPEVTINDGTPDNLTIGQTFTFVITASVSDGGQLSYQWYEMDASDSSIYHVIEGANSAQFTPPVLTAIGEMHRYKCVITNTVNSFLITDRSMSVWFEEGG